MLILSWSIAFAQSGGYYHPTDISRVSSSMGEASENLATAFDERARLIKKLAAALRHYRESLDLLGDRAPQAEWKRLERLEQQYHRQEAVLQRFADALVEDFDTAMVGAMGRALKPFPNATRCEAEVPVPGPRIPGMPGRTSPNPECKGIDLNAKVAARMDSDPQLAPILREIFAREWPNITVDGIPQPPIGDGVERWVGVRVLHTTVVPERLRELDHQDDVLRNEVEAKLEHDNHDVDHLKSRVDEIERVTRAARSELGGRVLEQAEARFAKWKDFGEIGWCANPDLLGGCLGTDTTRKVVSQLKGDRKFMNKIR